MGQFATFLHPYKFINLVIAGVFGYLFAVYTHTFEEKPPSTSDGFYDGRKSRNLLSQSGTSVIMSTAPPPISISVDMNECECQTNFDSAKGLKVNYFANGFENAQDYVRAKSQRSERLEKWKKRNEVKSPLKAGSILTADTSQISFPYYGINVEPLGTVRIPGVMLSDDNDQTEIIDYDGPVGCLESDIFCVHLEANYGALKAFDLVTVKQQYNYDNKSSLTLKADSLSDLNQVLESLLYSNTLYEPKGAIDIITLVYRSSRALIPVHVIYKPQPILFNPGQKSIEDLVTICIKTFERYPCLYRLLKSIRTKYPDVKVIVADDSINYRELTYSSVTQYKMPAGTGFNKGKSLAVSQVTTEYVLWIDDDFEFTNGTDIELMVDILEDTDLDIVGGKAGSSGWGYTSIFNRIHGNSGDCLYRLYGHRGVVPNHPTCKYADLIQNFFLARTMAVRRIGFDGEFQRVAHKEFFADGLGELKIAFCSNISVDHEHSCLRSSAAEEYQKYRKPDEDEIAHINRAWFHRSNFKCIAEKKPYGANYFLRDELKDL